MADTANSASAPKPINTIVLDAGPILKNTPPLSTLLAQCEEHVTTLAIVREIKPEPQPQSLDGAAPAEAERLKDAKAS